MTELHVSGLDELKRAHGKAMASICKDVAMGMLASSDDLAEASRQLGRAMYSATDAFGDYHEAYDDAVDLDDFSTDPDRWYCRYCGSANHPDALYCGEIIDGRGVRRCGAPRPEDGAELPEELAAIRDIPRDISVDVVLPPWARNFSMGLFLSDRFWIAVQAFAKSTGLDIETEAELLRDGILKRSLMLLDQAGVYCSPARELGNDTRGAFEYVCDKAFDLDWFTGCLHHETKRVRDKKRGTVFAGGKQTAGIWDDATWNDATWNSPTPYADAARAVKEQDLRDMVLLKLGR